MSFLIGKILGPYIIQAQLGQGGMATVYKAYHPELDRHVAIKVIDASLAKEKDFIERFKREARVIANFDNVHIVPVYDLGQYKGQPFYVLKLINGPTLRERMKKAPLSNREILDIVLAVGDALQYAHGCGVLHRDIKPSNVMIAREGKIYLTDFGLAKLIENSTSLTGEKIIGTPHYISPEQAQNVQKIDEGTDIYSFGVMIYEMVVGCLPFDGKTAFSIIEDHIRRLPPLPTSIKPDLPKEVEAVILKAIAKNRNDRYDSITSLVKAFQKAWVSSHTDLRPIPETENATHRQPMLLSERGDRFLLSLKKNSLGRNTGGKNIINDIDLTSLDVKKIVSRLHARILVENNEFYLQDLNSHNGTFVDGERIAPDQPRKLKSGDVIEFGSKGVKLKFVR
jgi:serine/threonine protein kinase